MRKSKGFTLIELLVVISVIAVLMAILMPALQKVKKQAQGVACLSNLKQWGLYTSMYTDDNNGYFHQGWWSGRDYRGTWVAILRPYYQGASFLRRAVRQLRNQCLGSQPALRNVPDECRAPDEEQLANAPRPGCEPGPAHPG